jgi:ubiquinone/menaquinone biosynthesis C-methylase UbiE
METKTDIMADAHAFMKSRVILTGAELDVFTRLDGNFLTVVELIGDRNLDKRATTRILDCLVALKLLEKQGTKYRTSPAGSTLSSRHPESVLPMVRHMSFIWRNWSRLTAVAECGINPNLKPVVDALPEDERRSFIGAMHVAARQISMKIADAFDSSAYKILLDVGGGSGAYTIAFLKKNPQLRAVVFDLKNVIPITKEKIREEGVEDRVTFVEGDFYKDSLPAGCDLALLSAIIHQNSPDQNLALYQKIYRALHPGGALLIRDHIMDTTRTWPLAGTLFALNMLVNTPAGDTYTFREVKQTLESAGFKEVEWIVSGDKMDSLVRAVKPV